MTVRWLEPVTERDAGKPRTTDPRTAAQNSTLLFPDVPRLVGSIRAKPVRAPFPNVAQHIAQSLCRISFREQANRRDMPNGPVVIRERGIERWVITPRKFAALWTSRRPFPFRFSGQSP